MEDNVLTRSWCHVPRGRVVHEVWAINGKLGLGALCGVGPETADLWFVVEGDVGLTPCKNCKRISDRFAEWMDHIEDCETCSPEWSVT